MSVEVTVRDEQTGKIETVRIPNGQYLIVTVEPCWLDGTQFAPMAGTVVLTVKDNHPQALPEIAPTETPRKGHEDFLGFTLDDLRRAAEPIVTSEKPQWFKAREDISTHDKPGRFLEED